VKAASKNIKELLKQQKRLHNFETIKKNDGVRAYLRALAHHEDWEFPHYWTHYKGLCGVTSYQATPKRSELNSNSALYVALTYLIQLTWDPDKSSGLGRDAVNLTHKGIQIIKIWVIENPSLYQKYLTQKRYLCGRGCENLFPKIDGLVGELEVQTRGLGMVKVFFRIQYNINNNNNISLYKYITSG